MSGERRARLFGLKYATQLYYTSRTHTQLRQLTSELLKTSFARTGTVDPPSGATNDSIPPSNAVDGAIEKIGVSLVPLGSRKQLCINDSVRALGKAAGDERMNEACLDMQKAGKSLLQILRTLVVSTQAESLYLGKTRCEYLPGKDQEGLILDARDSILVSDGSKQRRSTD